MEKPFRWGIMGGGKISAKFAADIRSRQDAEVYALASQSANFDIPAGKQYTDYAAFATDDAIDAVYIGTIHPMHARCAEICLRAGKPVLCEKPVTMNAAECERLQETAREQGTFFMEAMWMRTLPASRELVKFCQETGPVRYLQLSFGNAADPAASRLFKAALGGGAILDLGIYGVHFANMVIGEHPSACYATARLNGEGVDTETAVRLEYPGGAVAEMSFSSERRMRNEAFVSTESAEFSVPFFWRPDRILQSPPNKAFEIPEVQSSYYPVQGAGYGYEAKEVERCLEQGLLESPLVTHADSLQCMRTLDEIHRICGVCYALQ